MKSFPFSYRTLLFVVLAVINITVAAYCILAIKVTGFGNREVMGISTELLSQTQVSRILGALGIVLFIYLFCMGVFHTARRWIPPKNSAQPPPVAGNTLFLAVCALQVFYIAVFFLTGYGRAGSTVIAESNLKYLLVLLPADYLFFVYLGIETHSRKSLIASFVYLISSLARGWAGGFIFVVLFKTAELLEKGKLRMSLVVSTIALIALSPVIHQIKAVFRQTHDISLPYVFSSDFVHAVSSRLPDNEGYWYFIFDSIFLRLNLVTGLIDVQSVQHELDTAFSSGSIRPFYEEGFVQILLRRLSLSTELPSLPGYVTFLLYPELDYVDDAWASHPTIAAYFMCADPKTALFHATYIVVLIAASTILTQRHFGSRLADNITYTLILFLVVPGWTGAFQAYVQAQIIMAIVLHFGKTGRQTVDKRALRESAPLREIPSVPNLHP